MIIKNIKWSKTFLIFILLFSCFLIFDVNAENNHVDSNDKVDTRDAILANRDELQKLKLSKSCKTHLKDQHCAGCRSTGRRGEPCALCIESDFYGENCNDKDQETIRLFLVQNSQTQWKNVCPIPVNIEKGYELDTECAKKIQKKYFCDATGATDAKKADCATCSKEINSCIKKKPDSKPTDGQESWYPEIGKLDACGGVLSADLLGEINKIYRTVSLILVVTVIIFGMMDFVKATGSDDADAMKKAVKRFTNRIIITILIAILPIVLEFILTLFGDENMKTCIDQINK